MQAVVFHGIGDIRLEDVPEPTLEQPTDAIVRLTASAICGTDLHMVRGTMGGMKPGTILGHEGVGTVEALGKDVRNLKVGDRVVIASTVGCGSCAYCRAGYFAMCDVANPNGPLAGTVFFGGPESTGPLHGMQAEKVRVPFAHVGLVKLPDEVTDEQAILCSDILPTAWFGAINAEIKRGNTVAVFGCGPVGLLAILCAQHMGAGRVFAIDEVRSRLEVARGLGAEVIDFCREDPVATLRRLTNGIGVDRAIDAVGVDGNHGPGCSHAEVDRCERELAEIAPRTAKDGDNWHPGDGPTQALRWAVQGLCKAGTLSIIGVYPESVERFPIGEAMNKNLTLKMGVCNHRKYLPELIELVRTGAMDPCRVLTQERALRDVIAAFKAFDKREPEWVKVELEPTEI